MSKARRNTTCHARQLPHQLVQTCVLLLVAFVVHLSTVREEHSVGTAGGTARATAAAAGGSGGAARHCAYGRCSRAFQSFTNLPRARWRTLPAAGCRTAACRALLLHQRCAAPPRPPCRRCTAEDACECSGHADRRNKRSACCVLRLASQTLERVGDSAKPSSSGPGASSSSPICVSLRLHELCLALPNPICARPLPPLP